MRGMATLPILQKMLNAIGAIDRFANDPLERTVENTPDLMTANP